MSESPCRTSLGTSRNLRLVTEIKKILGIIPSAARELLAFRQSLELRKAVDNLNAFMNKVPPPRSRDHEERLVPIMEAERDRGFSFLFGLGTIAIWSALEAYIDDLLLSFFSENCSYIEAKAVQSIKVRLGEFEPLAPDDKRRFILDTLKRDHRHAPGVGRFEGVLGEFDLGGEVPRELRDHVLELGEVRNIVVHNDSVADARFVERCPSVAAAAGQEVSVDEGMLHRYGSAAMGYGVLVLSRLTERDGQNTQQMSEFVAKMVEISAGFR